MPVITETQSFKLLEVVLSQNKPFKIEDIVPQLQELGIEENLTSIKKALECLRDNWIITEIGSYYSVA